jgi:hypothetical protein
VFPPSARAGSLAQWLRRAASPLASLIVLLWAASGFGQGTPAEAPSQLTVSADFAYRHYNTPRIPPDGFGINLAGLKDPNTLTTLSQAGITESRKMSDIPEVYATTTPDWQAFDWNMNLEQTAGFHPTVVLSYSPPWLQPTKGPCARVPTAPPSNFVEWGQIAASYVAHLDKTFPGLVKNFEIWNEPNLQKSFCVADNQDATRLNAYLVLYAAAASAMRAQAKADGVSIGIGGPGIYFRHLADVWIPALLSDPSTAPNVDFVSYHLYLTGAKQIQQGMKWSDLYTITQSSTEGELFFHLAIEALVRKGKQPKPWATPIYVTEFNDNWDFVHDCCRNDPTFGPLWNTVLVANYLNSIYVGAKHVPAKLFYFAGNAGAYVCIVGTWDPNMDCNPTNLQPYPQFYAYQLLASSNYLGLSAGGFMAASVSPGSTQSGLMNTAFYAGGKDVILVVNPTSTAHASVRVLANRSGIANAVGTEFLLNQANPQIAQKALSLTKISGGYRATISVPAYSVVAVTIAR